MESSNNNLNTLDPNEEHDGGNIDTLDLLIKYQGDCVSQACKARDPTGEKGDEEMDYFPLETLDKNVSFSETKFSGQEESKPGHQIPLEKRTSSTRKLKMSFDNTYRMEPQSDQYFVWYKAKAIMASVVNPLFSSFEYDSKAAAYFCKLVCSKVLFVLKKKNELPRYRYVCLATVAQLKQQGLVVAERCLWNTAYDNVAVCTLENKSAVLVVTLYAIYLE